jgi:hypothetical protein
MGLSLVAAAMLSLPTTVAAKGGADVVRTGSCSAASDWKLKLNREDGRIEVEFEVDQNVNGQAWNVKLKHNGNVFWSGQRTTMAPSGSFEVNKLTNNAAGTDSFVGRAVNQKTGEVCRGTASI